MMPPTSIDAVPMPPFIARPMPNSLPTEAPAPAPTLPSASESLRRRFAGGVAGGGIGADARVADPEVEQDRRRNDRHDERRSADAIGGRADRRADAALVEPAHHAARGVEAEGAAAGEHDRMHLVDRVDRIEQLGLARPGRRAAHVDAGDGAVAGDHDRAAGRPARVGEVADLEAGDRGQPRHRVARPPGAAARAAPPGRHGGRPARLQANTPAVVCMRRDTSPSWNSVSPKVISITVRRLK